MGMNIPLICNDLNGKEMPIAKKLMYVSTCANRRAIIHHHAYHATPALTMAMLSSMRSSARSLLTGTRTPPCALLSTVDLSKHTLNCSNALKKADESHSFVSLAQEDVSILQGIGPTRLEALNGLGIKTIPDLAKYKYYHTARAIVALAATEEGERHADSVMNINKALDKEHETQTFRELVDAPVSALQGISETKGVMLHELGVTTIADLAQLKYIQWAESMVWLSKFEE